jgi:hypothetical protein
VNDAISRRKLLEWLDVEIELSKGSDSVLKVDRWAYSHVKKEVESGRLDNTGEAEASE